MDDPKVTRDRVSQVFELPQEVIWKMLYYLPPKDVVNFCVTYRGAAQIICHNNDFWFEKIMKDFGDVFEIRDIPIKDRYKTYQEYWKDAHDKLFDCVIANKVDCVFTLLQLGIDPNILDEFGWSLLMWASKNGYMSIVRLLLKHGAEPKYQDTWGRTALSLASSRGHMDIARLLEQIDDPN